MVYEGNIIKMRVEYNSPISYYLPVGGREIFINSLLGKDISVRYQGIINCIKCGRETKTSFAQGYCYPCFISAPETEECVLHPELCRAHEGIARDMEFARNHCLIDHFVYIALSSEIKIGVTRRTQIPARWMDQGATSAIKLARAPNRYLAGLIEVALKTVFKDKTNWRRMLTDGIIEHYSLIEEKRKAENSIPEQFKEYITNDDEIFTFSYPVNEYPGKVKGISLDKAPEYTGKLAGIKGQYLIFKDGSVLNIRKHAGYFIQIKA